MLEIIARFIQDSPYATSWFILAILGLWFLNSRALGNRVKRLRAELAYLESEYMDFKDRFAPIPRYEAEAEDITEKSRNGNQNNAWGCIGFLLIFPAIAIGSYLSPFLNDLVQQPQKIISNPFSGKYRGIGVGLLNSNNYSLSFDMSTNPAGLVLTNENNQESYFFSGETRLDGNVIYINGKLENESTILGIPIEGQLTRSRFTGTITTITGQYRLDLSR